MNGTRRGLNRALLGVFGLVLIATGALATLAGTSRGFAQRWILAGTTVRARIQERLGAARIPGMDISWWTVALLGLLLLVAVLLVCWISSQGTGRSNQLAVLEGEAGTTAVDTAVAGQAIKGALAGNTQVLNTSVQSWKSTRSWHAAKAGSQSKRSGNRAESGLKITVQARKGAQPAELAAAVGRELDGLDALLGTQIPVLVRIKAGTRTKFARSERVA